MSARRQWVFSDPCGCPFGVMEAGQVDSEAAAFLEFYETAAAMRKAVARGVTATLMPHERYVADVMPRMLSSYVCPHGGAA